ncbi:major facilitator superfamily domain-containing protein 9-like [Periplaneta americana]|uniref:major facilitator superfamily domain-containing protein 9-like n=1 Tax=Periplaneta americana TaxID=6978 RepID=UPI0037E8E66C
MTEITKVRLLYTVAFMDLFACSMAVPLLSVHLRGLGASHFTIGVVSSLYAGLQLVSSPIIGSWSDIRGHHFVLQLTLLICSFLYFGLGASAAIPVIMLTRVGLGLLKHTQTLCRTLLTDMVPSKDQMVVQSRLVSFGSVGFIVGPVIGGHMTELNNGFYYVCCLVMIFFWINFAIVYFYLPNVPRTHRKNSTEKSTDLVDGLSKDCGYVTIIPEKVDNTSSKKKIGQKVLEFGFFQAVTHLSQVNWSVYWDVFALRFLLGFSQAVHYQNFSLMLKDHYGITPTGIGYTISLQGLIGATTGFLIGWISKFYKNDKDNSIRTLHAFGVLTLSFLFMNLASSLAFFLLCLVPLAAAGSLLRITTSEIILQRTEPDQRGSLIGSAQSMSSIARLVAPLCSGLAFDWFGFYGTSLLRLAAPVTATALSAVLVLRGKKTSKVA